MSLRFFHSFLIKFNKIRLKLVEFMMRKCMVCNGKGFLWMIPNPNIDPSADSAGSSNTGVPCWRCVGRGNVPDSYPNDVGEGTES